MDKPLPELVFVGDRLEVRDAPSLTKLDRARWSASGVKSIENCPASWAADKLLPEPPDPFGAAEIGTASHKVLEVLFSLPMPERTPERAMDILATLESDFSDEVAAPQGPAELMDWRGQVAAKVNGIFKLEDPDLVDVVGTEHKLLVDVGGVPMIGFVDRLDRLPDGSVRAIDYKGLALDTLIPTPDGWTTMAELAVGGTIFGSDGHVGSVVGKSSVHHRDCWRLDFEYGQPITCDDIHLWNVVVDGEWLFDEVRASRIAEFLEQGHRVTITAAKPIPEPGVMAAEAEAVSGMAEHVIVAATRVESVPTQCISVDTPDHTYLAGAQFTPTHNSGKVKYPNQYGDAHGDQIRLYAAALAAEGRNVRDGALYYIGGPVKRDVPIVSREVDRVVADFQTTYAEMKESAAIGSYRTKAGPLCGWCPLATVCPTAAANNRSTPKVERARLGTSLGIRTEVFTPAPSVVHDGPVTVTNRKKRPMYQWSTNEAKSWEPTVTDQSGKTVLNPNGYSAIGHVGNAGLAVETIFNAPNPDLRPAPKVSDIEAFAKTIDFIVEKAYRDLTGSQGYVADSGLSTRIRGAFRSVLTFTPPPFGLGVEDWDKWVETMGKRIIVVMDSAMKLHVEGPGDRPWATLAK